MLMFNCAHSLKIAKSEGDSTGPVESVSRYLRCESRNQTKTICYFVLNCFYYILVYKVAIKTLSHTPPIPAFVPERYRVNKTLGKI